VTVDPIFAALGDPVRRRILEILSAGEHSAGAILAVLRERGPVTQPAASQHLKALRQAGLVTVEADGNRRLYRLDPAAVQVARGWLGDLLDPAARFTQPLDALATEVARGKRDRRRASGRSPAAGGTSRHAV
jgi:DNA-binding transcriptional ArsR family regulator